MIAEIWAGALKIEKIGIHDNFFELGGHSLLATQVLSRVRGALEEEIPLRMLFEYPTVAGLAKQVIGSQPPSLGTEEMTALLTELESFSEQEADNQLANMRRQSPSSGTN